MKLEIAVFTARLISEHPNLPDCGRFLPMGFVNETLVVEEHSYIINFIATIVLENKSGIGRGPPVLFFLVLLSFGEVFYISRVYHIST